jgi:hypothetical protein
MSLIALTYVSAADHFMEQDELLHILDQARTKNSTLGVTGMLLYRDGWFIQVLEGEAEVVRDLYDHIAEDSRHHHVLTVSEEAITERQFGEWSMGFADLQGMDPAEIPGWTDFLDKDFDPNFFTADPSRAQAMLELFREGVQW